MLDFQVQWLPIVVGAVVNVAIGFAWYATPLFGRAWMRETGKTVEQIKQASNAAPYLGAVVGAFVTALVIALLVENALPGSLTDALLLATLVWLAFFTVPTFMNFSFEGRSWVLFTIYASHQLVAFLVSTGIYYVWPVGG